MRFIAVLALLAACGGPDGPPVRGVIENDLDGWSFRRYQSVLDVEVWVKGNRAVAHTASYARKDAEARGQLDSDDVVSAFVTRYQRDDGIAVALVRFARRLASESGYRVEEREVEGERVVEVHGAGESWVMWPSRRHVVKIGGRGRESIPDPVVEAYGELYPSGLRQGALEAPLEPEPELEPATPVEPADPDNPRPDWNKGKKKKKKGAS